LQYRFKLDFEDDFQRVRDEKLEVAVFFDERLKEIHEGIMKRAKAEDETLIKAKNLHS
jgi:hypothetical protein